MKARQKLTHIHVSDALVLASVLGDLFQSWVVFLITSAALIAGDIYVGDIRPGIRRTATSELDKVVFFRT